MEIVKTAPLLTPFTDDSQTLSEVRVARLMRLLLENGVDAFVVASEAGEFPTLTMGERKQLLEIVIREAHGKHVLAHVSTLSTNGTLDLAQHAARHGARAGVVIPPHYGTYHDDEIAKHFETLAAFSNLPLIVVDPQDRLAGSLGQYVAGLNMITMADRIEGQPKLDTDRFHAGIYYCSPVFLFAGLDLSHHIETAHAIMGLMEHEHPSAVAKSGLELMGLELGTPRQPRRPLMAEPFQALRHLLADATT